MTASAGPASHKDDRKGASDYMLEFEAPVNGRISKATITVLDATSNNVLHTDRADMTVANERRKVVKRIAEKLGIRSQEKLKELQDNLDNEWNKSIQERRRTRERAQAGSPEAVPISTVQLLDTAPLTLRRPLCLIAGRAYAATWVSVRHVVSQSVQNGAVVRHEPPLVKDEEALLIVSENGCCWSEKEAPDARPLKELGLTISLPSTLRPERAWSGSGVKRYLAGERPDPAEVFTRVKSVVDRFIDFSRSLSSQDEMCELAACYILGTYLLDAFHVVGYLWPNGERGTGKTSFLHVIVELAYLGELILAGSSYACLRDLADYGATLAFDDAEAVMDTRRTDPDKRTLLLAGNRKGATVTVKELDTDGKRWTTRHVSTFCPRAFSAIHLPDEVLGSRSIIVPLIRSGDPRRAKANCHDLEAWPCDRRRLIDDLWALGLAHLAELPSHDREAAEKAEMAGRNLDPWRSILGVAHWLQTQHNAAGLFDRMLTLATDYQSQERAEYEDSDRVRVLFRALLKLAEAKEQSETVEIQPRTVAELMLEIAKAEDLAEPDKPFTSARKVGYLLKRQRFRRGDRSARGKTWEATRKEIEDACRAYSIGVSGVTAGDEVPF
jgi:hypothetical protein